MSINEWVLIASGLDFLILIFVLIKILILGSVLNNLQTFINALVEVIRKNYSVQEETAIRSMETLEKVRDIRKEVLGIEGTGKGSKNAVSKRGSKPSKSL